MLYSVAPCLRASHALPAAIEVALLAMPNRIFALLISLIGDISLIADISFISLIISLMSLNQ